MREQDVFGLQVAVDDALAFEQDEAVEDLLGEAADEFQREAGVVVQLDEFVEVHAEELGGDAEVAAEVEGLGEVDHAVVVKGVLLVALAGFIELKMEGVLPIL